MTIKELKHKIENLDDLMDVMIEQTNDESRYNLVQKADVRPVTFMSEEIPQQEWPTVECFVITDDF